MHLPYMISLDSLHFTSNIMEMNAGMHHLPFEVSVLPLKHLPYSQGYRVEIDGAVISYCLDTGYCENAILLAKDSDLLILECTSRPGDIRDHHLCPELCAQIAVESNAHMLALTHFEGCCYPDNDSRKKSGSIAKSIFVNTLACYDGMELELNG